MGFGGILAAMASGLGTGMKENVEWGRKEEEAQKERDWKAEQWKISRDHESSENELNRQHAFELEDHKHRNEMSMVAYRAKIDIQKSRALAGSGGGSDKQSATDIIRSLGMTREAISGVEEQIAAYGGQNVPQALTDKLTSLNDHYNKLLSLPEAANAYQNGDNATKTGLTLLGYDPSRHAPKKPIKPSEAVKIASGVLNGTTTAPAKTEKPLVPDPSKDFKSTNSPSLPVSYEARELYKQYLSAGEDREKMLEKAKNTPPYLSKYGL